jgi:hypothetical protein
MVYEVGVAAGVAAPGVSTAGVEPTATTGVTSVAGVATPAAVAAIGVADGPARTPALALRITICNVPFSLWPMATMS